MKEMKKNQWKSKERVTEKEHAVYKPHRPTDRILQVLLQCDPSFGWGKQKEDEGRGEKCF